MEIRPRSSQIGGSIGGAGQGCCAHTRTADSAQASATATSQLTVRWKPIPRPRRKSLSNSGYGPIAGSMIGSGGGTSQSRGRTENHQKRLDSSAGNGIIWPSVLKKVTAVTRCQRFFYSIIFPTVIPFNEGKENDRSGFCIVLRAPSVRFPYPRMRQARSPGKGCRHAAPVNRHRDPLRHHIAMIAAVTKRSGGFRKAF